MDKQEVNIAKIEKLLEFKQQHSGFTMYTQRARSALATVWIWLHNNNLCGLNSQDRYWS